MSARFRSQSDGDTRHDVRGHAQAMIKSGRSRHAGQALVEACLGLALLVAVLMSVLAIAKLHTLRYAVVQAAGALALECSVRYETCKDPSARSALVGDVQSRFFSSDASQSLPNPHIVDALWSDGSGQPFVAAASDVSAAVLSVDSSAVAGAVSGVLPNTDGRAGLSELRAGLPDMGAVPVGPDAFGLTVASGLFQAQVSVRARATPQIMVASAASELPLGAQSAVLADSWTAWASQGGSTSVQERVLPAAQLPRAQDAAAVQAGFAPVHAALAAMQALGLEPGAAAFFDHQADLDIVPPDRRGP